MNIEHLREFLELANTLNFTKASQNLHMTQPTLSRHIAELERQVGSPLFTRTSTSVKLTHAGRLLYEKANALMANYSSILEDVHAAATLHTTTLKVSGSSVQPTISRLFSKMATRAAFEGRPIRFEYYKTRSLSNESPAPYALDALKNGEIDFSIDTCGYNEVPPRGFECLHICDEPLTLIASSDNALANATNLEIEDLFANTLFAFAVQQHCPKVLFAPFLTAGYHPQRTKVAFVDNMMEIPEQLGRLTDEEVVPMQRHYCSTFGFDQDTSGRLTTLDVIDPRCRSGIWAIWRKGEQDRAILEAVDLLRTIVDETKAAATVEQWASDDVLWESAFYIG